MLATTAAPRTINALADVSVRCRDSWRHASSLRFVLPIRFAEDTYESRGAAAQAARLPGRKRLLWQPFALPVDDLMPHVRRYLNSADGDASTATLLTAETNELEWLTGGRDSVWALQLSKGRQRRFRVAGAHLLLFRLDIGFLVLDIAPEGESAEEWFDLLHYARFFRGDRCRPIFLDCEKTRAGKSALDLLAAGANLTSDTPGADDDARIGARLPGLGTLLDVLLRTSELPAERLTTADQLNSPGQLLAYPVLFLSAPPGLDAAVLAHALGSHHSGRALDREVPSIAEESVLPYGERSWLFSSTEGAGYVAIVPDGPADDFTRTVLPAHLRTEYFLGYLLAAFQRYALLRLSEEVADIAVRPDRKFADTQRRVLDFTGRAMFVQVTHAPHHQAWYRHVQEVLQVLDLNREVRDEVRAFQDFEQAREAGLQDHRSRMMEVLVAVITGVILPLQLVAALFADRVHDWPFLRYVPVEVQAYGTLGLGVALAVLTYWLLRRAGRRAG